MFRGCIQSDLVVLHSVIHIKNLPSPEWLKCLLKDSPNLKKCSLWQIKTFYLVVFSYIDRSLTAKYTSEKVIAK